MGFKVVMSLMQTIFQLTETNIIHQTRMLSPPFLCFHAITISVPTSISSNLRPSRRSSGIRMFNVSPQPSRPTSRNLRMHRINATIPRPLTHRQCNFGRHNTDHQTRNLLSIFFGAVSKSYAPVQVIFQVWEDIGFIQRATMTFLDFLLYVSEHAERTGGREYGREADVRR